MSKGKEKIVMMNSKTVFEVNERDMQVMYPSKLKAASKKKKLKTQPTGQPGIVKWRFFNQSLYFFHTLLC